MNADQKKRATELLANWRTEGQKVWDADRMAALLQELIDVPEVEPALVVEVEPDYWSGGHYCEGSKPHISPLKVWKLPVGTKLYTAPLVTKLSDERILEIWASNSGRPVTMGKARIIAQARAIERELLGE